MRSKLFLTFSAALFFASILFAQQVETPPAATPEDTAFNAIVESMAKARQGGPNPSEADYKARREAGLEMAAKAKQFLKDYPSSAKSEDVAGMVDMGLFGAADAGDDSALAQLQTRATEVVKDPKASDDLKLHAFSMNFMAQWERKNKK